MINPGQEQTTFWLPNALWEPSEFHRFMLTELDREESFGFVFHNHEDFGRLCWRSDSFSSAILETHVMFWPTTVGNNST